MKSNPQALWVEFLAATAKVARELLRWNYCSTFRDHLPDRLAKLETPDPVIRDVQLAIGNLELRYGPNLDQRPVRGRPKPGKNMKRFHAAARKILPYLEAHPNSTVGPERLRRSITLSDA